MSGSKFWVVFSTDLDKHPPETVTDSESHAEQIANKKAIQSPGTHFYVLEALSEHIGLVEVERNSLWSGVER